MLGLVDIGALEVVASSAGVLGGVVYSGGGQTRSYGSHKLSENDVNIRVGYFYFSEKKIRRNVT